MKNLKHVYFLIAIFSVGFLSAGAKSISAQDDQCNAYSAPSLGVTLCAPQNWTIENKSSVEHPVMLGKANNGIMPNINLQHLVFDGSIAATVDAGVKEVLQSSGDGSAKTIELKSRSEFTGATKGIKVVYDAESKTDLSVRVIQYCFPAMGNIKILVTATMPLAEAEEFEALIDASMKTFKVSSKPIKTGTR